MRFQSKFNEKLEKQQLGSNLRQQIIQYSVPSARTFKKITRLSVGYMVTRLYQPMMRPLLLVVIAFTIRLPNIKMTSGEKSVTFRKDDAAMVQ